MTIGVSDPPPMGYRPVTTSAIPRRYWPDEFRQTLLVVVGAATLTS
jgi:hypothetical protein